jgi:hypothetical protein
MSFFKFHFLAAALLGTVTLGCKEAQLTEPDPGSSAPRLNFSNGLDNLPNVFRFEGMVGGATIVDTRTDLVAIDGLPETPADLAECGGREDILNLADFQISGNLSGVFHVLAQAELNIHVYRLSTFVDICTSEPLARGTGRLIINDNDAGVSGTRTNSFGHRRNGPVTLANGGAAHLAAHSRFLINKDGTFQHVSSGVTLGR